MKGKIEPSEKRGLHSIERSGLRATGRHFRNTSNRLRDVRDESPPPRNTRREQHSKRTFTRIIGLLIITVVIIIVFLSTTFSSAQLKVTLATVEVNVNGVFEATQVPSRMGDISYYVSDPISLEKSATITKTRRETRVQKSSGMITVYNTNISGETLDLVNRTRFKTPDGRLYRLTSRQSIPGGKTVGGEFRPGTKDVKIEADDLGPQTDGERFNIDEIGTRLSIPGLARYRADAGSYALTKIKISGGFAGEILIADEDEEELVYERLKKEIRQELAITLEELLRTNTLGTERIVLEGGVFTKFEELKQISKEDSVIVGLRGTLRAVEFRKKDIAGLLAPYTQVEYITNSGDEILPNSLKKGTLTINIESNDSDNEFNITKSQKFSFRLSGATELLWDVDDDRFLEDVSGKSEDVVRNIIQENYPQIITIDTISIFPFWISTMPSTKAKITLEKNKKNDTIVGKSLEDREAILAP